MKKLVKPLALALLALFFTVCEKGNSENRGLGPERSAGTQTETAVAAVGSADHKKYALVIGNGAYTNIRKLNNPVNDANDMTAVLESLGFTVDKLVNGTLDQMENAATRLKNRLSAEKSSYGFFFYAGHGVQSDRENYLIPVDANITSENYLRQRAVSVQVVLDELNDAGNELNVVVLDACRDNPFSWRGRSGSRGLQVLSNQPADSIIVYATSAGSTAADGEGRNGLFTSHLLNNLKKPGLEVNEVFRQTGADVSRASNRAQMPAVYNQFFGTAYLGALPVVSVTVQPVTPPQPAPVVQPPPAPSTVQPIAPPPERPAPANMVRVDGGTFLMGSNNGEDDEKPVHSVTVKSFYMAKYPVTQKEWREVMGTTVRQQRDMADKSWGMYGEGDNYPMYNVNWLEAVDYCNKLSQKEGLTPCYRGNGGNITCDWNANGYRLPTEAEWEYAAKGGVKDVMTTEYSGSNSVDAVAWYSENSGSSTHPVGQKRANSLGIYDMSGNVWEWCWDWYDNYSSSAQTDPRGASSGSHRVFRGGSWGNTAAFVRSAYRGIASPSGRSYLLGFRLVRP